MLAPPAQAQTIATSTQISDASVSIYRDPNRGSGPVNAAWPGGYALISETRTITIPAGDGVIRFEGVAEGMLPESALVTGLPTGVREKNRDARLLSPAGLVDAFLKRRVHLIRTSLVNGKRVEQDAVITAGPDGGVLIQSAEGTEALGCSGLPERMRYDGVPQGLSAKSTLSIMTRSARAQRATVKLTYIAQGFDWSAHYVATTDLDTGKMHLLAWATLINGGAQSFPNARVQVIAGQANYRAQQGLGKESAVPLMLRCWPMDNTATHPRYEFSQLPFYSAPTEEIGLLAYDKAQRFRKGYALVPPPPVMTAGMMAPPPPPAPPAMVAQQEALGDLKLYRIPERVTVAAQSSKQVAMIDQPKVDFGRVFYYDPYNWGFQRGPTQLRLEMDNVKVKGLGVPLPAGAISTSEMVEDNALFTGEARLRDYAIGEKIWYAIGSAILVQGQLTVEQQDTNGARFRIDITNANPESAAVEIALQGQPDSKTDGLAYRDGRWTIRGTVPANDKASFWYTMKYR